MDIEDNSMIHQISDGSISASHLKLKPLPIFVGPSVKGEFNTIRSRLIPCACFRREDNSFDFESSFIFDFDAGPLKELLGLHPGSKLSIFGHADPVGKDEFNKVLSGRRAQSAFGLLIRDVKLWEELYRHHDRQGKDNWGVKAVQVMLNINKFNTGRSDGILDEPTKEQLKKFETERSLPPNGFDTKQEIASSTFKQLATEYMDRICIDDDAEPFKLTREDFLARGKGKDGKGDIQGCGEFNPILLFSKADKARLDQKENQTERNSKNRPNRRVMILLFRPGSEIDPVKWPCPTVTEGVAGCKVRFFSDGEKRRQNTDEERQFSETQNTFACRFYTRLMNTSPCEQLIKLTTLRIRLIDDLDQPYKQMTYRLEIGGDKREGVTSADGVLEERIPQAATSGRLTLVHIAEDQGVEKPIDFWTLDLEIADELEDSTTITGSQSRLRNLGFFGSEQVTDHSDEQAKRALQRFQTFYKVNDANNQQEISGTLTQKTADKLKEIYGS